MRTTLTLFAVLLTVACGKSVPPVEAAQTSNGVTVELFFEHDGCKVYRFTTGYTHYYAVCGGAQTTTRTAHSESYQCGKSRCTRTVYRGMTTTVRPNDSTEAGR